MKSLVCALVMTVVPIAAQAGEAVGYTVNGEAFEDTVPEQRINRRAWC